MTGHPTGDLAGTPDNQERIGSQNSGPYFYCDGLARSHVGITHLRKGFRPILDGPADATPKSGGIGQKSRKASRLQLMRHH